jgi:hypothetical protein
VKPTASIICHSGCKSLCNVGCAVKSSHQFTFCPPSCPSVCPSAWNNSAPTGRIFIKFGIRVFSENLSKFHYNLTRITGTFHSDQCAFWTISRSVLLRMRNVSEKLCRENQNTHFVFNKISPENLAVYEMLLCCFIFVTTQCVCIFHSPLAGFSLLVFEVSWSHTTTRHSR